MSYQLQARKAFNRSLITLGTGINFLDQQHFDKCCKGVPVEHLTAVTETYNAKYKQSPREANIYMLKVAERVQEVRHAH